MLVPFRTRTLITGVYPDLVGVPSLSSPHRGVDWPIEFHSACHGRLLTWYVYWHKLVWSRSSSLRQREGIEIAKWRVPIRSPIDASRQVCWETQKLLRGIIPLKQLQGSVMVDNWRQGWEKAAKEVLNAQRYGCWPVSAATKWASVSWKKSYLQFFLAVAGKYYLLNWLIKFKTRWLFPSRSVPLDKLREVHCKSWECLFSFLEKYRFFVCVCVCFFGLKTPFTMAQLKRPILDPSVSCCLSEKIRRHWGKCTTAFTALAGPAPTSSSSSSFFFFDRLVSVFFGQTLAGTPSAGHPRGSFLLVHLWCHSCVSEGGGAARWLLPAALHAH